MEWFEDAELKMITDTVRDLSAREIEGKVVDLESLKKPDFPRKAVDVLAGLGFLWGPAPEDIGSAMSDISCVVLLSELAGACAGFAAIVATHFAALRSVMATAAGPGPLEKLFETGKEPPLLGIALETDMSGPGGPAANRYLAVPSGANADVHALFSGSGDDARMMLASGPALSGLSSTDNRLSGCDEMPTAVVTVTGESLDGFETIASGREASAGRGALVSSLKLYYSAVMQGAARSATVAALEYAKQRRQTGRPIIEHQNVLKKLVEMEVKNQSMASFLYRAALNAVDEEAFNLRDMLLAFTRAESEYVVNEAIQTLGGYGYMREYGLEKKLRDIKTLQALLPVRASDWLATRAS